MTWRAPLRYLAPLAILACGSDDPPEKPPPPAAQAPVRQAAENENLRIMVAQIGAAEACRAARGSMLGVPGDAKVPVGTLWIETCTARYDGSELTVRGSGRGWRWVSREKEKAGADFALRKSVRFAVKASLKGDVDVAYTPSTRVVTVWLTPKGRDAKIEPIGEVDVDGDGAWAAIVGTAGSVIGDSPDEAGAKQVGKQGREKILESFDTGVTVTASLCDGDIDLAFGHRKPGTMISPARERKDLDGKARLHPDGLIILGPKRIRRGTTLRVEPNGPIEASLVCRDDGEELAEAYLAQNDLPDTAAVVRKVVSSRTDLKVKKTSCREGFVVFRAARGAKKAVDIRWDVTGSGAGADPFIHCDEIGKGKVRAEPVSSEGEDGADGADGAAKPWTKDEAKAKGDK